MRRRDRIVPRFALMTNRLATQFMMASQAVSVAVVPGWSANAQPRREHRTTFSIDKLTDDLPGQEWIFVNGRLEGPLHSR